MKKGKRGQFSVITTLFMMEDGFQDGEEVEEVDPRSLKPDLYFAAQQNDTSKVLELLSGQVPATYVDDSNGWTPLHWAAKNGNVIILNKMIECGASAPYHRMVLKAKQDEAKRFEEEKMGGSSAPVAVLEGLAGVPEEKDEGTAGIVEAGAASAGIAVETIPATEGGSEIDPTATSSPVAPSGAIVEEQYEDDEDEDDEYGMEKRLETSVDLTKNTPLLWACVKGNLAIVWALLVDGYSPNDLDDMGNNGLHLAAAAGSIKIVKTLIDAGVRATHVNTYKNLPIDMATDKAVREMISDSMRKSASMTASDIEMKHDATMKAYTRMINSLQMAVGKAADLLGSFDNKNQNQNSPSISSISASIGDAIRSLSDAIRIGKEWCLDQESIAKGETFLKILELTQELAMDIATAEKTFPCRSQDQYIQHIHKIEMAITHAEGQGVSQWLLTLGKDLIQRAQIEYWISTMTARLSAVDCAMDHHEHDMRKLRASVVKGQVLNASPEVLEPSSRLLQRLDSELGMSRALLSFPTYKLPWTHATDPPPEGYYTEADRGHVKETEGYPHPPPGGEYVWEPSVTYSSLQGCILKLKEAFTGADALGANPATIAEAKAKLLKAEKDIKLLHVKEENDKLAGIEETKKKCKKKK